VTDGTQHVDFNLALLKTVADRIGKLREKAMFLGGTVLPLLVPQPVAAGIRAAKDVDLMIHVPSKAELWDFEDRLSDLGMKKLKTGSTCHWVFGQVHLDVLTTEPYSVDFINHWGREAVQQAQRRDLGGGLLINVVRPTHYVAIKFDAFYRRGQGRYETSVDIYDIMLVLRGSRDFDHDFIHRTSVELRSHLASELTKLLVAGMQWVQQGAPADPVSERFRRQWQPDVVERIRRIPGVH
jgi:hypothetical protein